MTGPRSLPGEHAATRKPRPGPAMPERTLPPFPVDDITLDAIEHALGGSFTVDPDGTHHLHGSDMTLMDLLNFLSGYDPSKSVQALNEYDTPIPDVYEYPDPIYHPHDVIRALIAEIRRLRFALADANRTIRALVGEGTDD